MEDKTFREKLGILPQSVEWCYGQAFGLPQIQEISLDLCLCVSSVGCLHENII